MRQCADEIRNLISAKSRCIWINTYEENEAINDIVMLMNNEKPTDCFSYSIALGCIKHKYNITKKAFIPSKPMPVQPNQLLNIAYSNITGNLEINTESEEDDVYGDENEEFKLTNNYNCFIIKDAHDMLSNSQFKRMLRDVLECPMKYYNPIFIISPIVSIPIELEKDITVIDYDTPSKEMITKLLNTSINAGKRSPNFIDVAEDEKIKIVDAASGLTFNEIINAFRLSIIKYHTLTSEIISDYKIQLIKKSNVLSYEIPKAKLSDIGGNQNFKNWVQEILASMTPEAKAYGCPRPKGYLALGVPGAAKTFSAQALAHEMNVPFLKLDMSKILNGVVGSSEKNIAQAIRMIKACAPCLLLIDEIEKSLSGMGSSNNSDSGTMARIIGSVLQFLNEDHGIYVVMTSNDVSQLPPELTRTGRVDCIWYFGIPTEKERREIFKIHFAKFNKEVSDEVLNTAVKSSVKFTGAEIEEAVKNTVRKAFFRSRNDNNENIMPEDAKSACSEIIPIAISSKENIAALEAYAKTRTRISNKIENKHANLNSDREVENMLLTMDDIKRR